jgi:hypothetical protein
VVPEPGESPGTDQAGGPYNNDSHPGLFPSGGR